MALQVYRQGDIALVPITLTAEEREAIVKSGTARKSRILKRGENGGEHRLQSDVQGRVVHTPARTEGATAVTNATERAMGRRGFLGRTGQVIGAVLGTAAGISLVHREHRTVAAPAGDYAILVGSFTHYSIRSSAVT